MPNVFENIDPSHESVLPDNVLRFNARARENEIEASSEGAGLLLEDLMDTLDRAAGRPNDTHMNTPSREEIDAKLETIEARMDGRLTAIQGSIEGLIGRMDERALRSDDRFARMEETIRDTQSSISNLKSTVILTAISTVLAIVLGVAAFNATVLSNMVASFESGKNTAASQAEVRRQAEETAALLKQVQQQLENTRSEARSSSK